MSSSSFRSKSSFLGCAALFLSSATQVVAHGYVGSISSGGVTQYGPKPIDEGSVNNNGSALRQVVSEQPLILNAAGAINAATMACKQTSNSPATALLSVAAGDELSIQWFNGNGNTAWPHNTGPIMTYMAACSDSTCGDDPTTLEFFKIQQDSYMEGSTTTWVQDLVYKGYPYNVTIPTALANGNYIMRHELINMAPGAGNDEDYPSCFQLTVTGGSGSGTPSSFASSLGSTYLAKFPGAYAASDAGLNADGYTYSTYDFPGPAIASVFGGSGGGNGGGNTTNSGEPTTTASVAGTTTKAAHATTKTSSGSAVPTTTSALVNENVIVTTVTRVFVLTMTMDENGAAPTTTSSVPSGNNLKVTTTATPTSSVPTSTATSTVTDLEDDCDDEPMTTTESAAPTSTAVNGRRHASARMRRSADWDWSAVNAHFAGRS